MELDCHLSRRWRELAPLLEKGVSAKTGSELLFQIFSQQAQAG